MSSGGFSQPSGVGGGAGVSVEVGVEDGADVRVAITGVGVVVDDGTAWISDMGSTCPGGIAPGMLQAITIMPITATPIKRVFEKPDL
jgi:hypothetical protein